MPREENNAMYEHVRKRLKEEMTRCGYNASNLSLEAGLHAGNLYRFLDGALNILSISDLKRLGKALGIDYKQLLP